MGMVARVSQLFEPFAQQVSKKIKDQWRAPVTWLWLSKEMAVY